VAVLPSAFLTVTVKLPATPAVSADGKPATARVLGVMVKLPELADVRLPSVAFSV
jgi:hypothetical protein